MFDDLHCFLSQGVVFDFANPTLILQASLAKHNTKNKRALESAAVVPESVFQYLPMQNNYLLRDALGYDSCSRGTTGGISPKPESSLQPLRLFFHVW